MAVMDRYGGAEARDRADCARAEAREAELDAARCRDCARFHLLEGDKAGISGLFVWFDRLVAFAPRVPGVNAAGMYANMLEGCLRRAEAAVCDLDGVEQIDPEATPRSMCCDDYERR